MIKNQHTCPTVAEFRQSGYRTTVRHFRPIIDNPELAKLIPHLPPKVLNDLLTAHLSDMSLIRASGAQGCIYPRGGQTQVTLEKDGKYYEAWAYCSCKDIFNRRKALTICCGQLAGQISRSV